MKRHLVLVALTLLVGLAWAGTAAAQVQFTGASSSRTLRVEGLKETVGPVNITANTEGMIVTNSAIFFQFSSSIVNAAGISGSSAGSTHPVDCVQTNGTSSSSCNGNLVVSVTTTSLTNDTIEVEFSDSVVFNPGSATAPDRIVVSQVRVNANGLGCGGVVNVTLSASVEPAFNATNNITFISPGPFQVGKVFPGPDTGGGCAATNVTLTAAPDLRTCEVQTQNDSLEASNLLDVNISENFREALTSQDDETNLSHFPATTNGSNIVVTFSNLPAGSDISLVFASLSLNSDMELSLVSTGGTGTSCGGTCVQGPGTAVYTFSVNSGDDTSDREVIDIDFSTSESGAGDPGSITASVSLGPTTPSTKNPLFATNSQPFVGGATTAFNVINCRTNLLFPFVANTAGYDTGIAIANTTNSPWTDPSLIGKTISTPGSTDTEPPLEPPSQEHGNCILNLFASTPGGFAGSPGTLTVTAGTTPDIPAGGTWADNLSDPAGPFHGKQGYVIAVCDFEFAHGFAFITAPFPNPGTLAIAEGYLALVIPDPEAIGFRTVLTEQRIKTDDGFRTRFVPTGEGLSQ